MITQRMIEAAHKVLFPHTDKSHCEACELQFINECSEVKSALEAAEAAAWEPIEISPKMKNVLMFAITDTETGNWKMDTGYWNSSAECWVWEGRQIRKYDTQPTHFIPLPPPPIPSSPTEST